MNGSSANTVRCFNLSAPSRPLLSTRPSFWNQRNQRPADQHLGNLLRRSRPIHHPRCDGDGKQRGRHGRTHPRGRAALLPSPLQPRRRASLAVGHLPHGRPCLRSPSCPPQGRSWLGHRRAGPGAGLPSRLHEAPAGRGSPGQRKESRASELIIWKAEIGTGHCPGWLG